MATKGIHPDQWVAGMIADAANVVVIEGVRWILVGLFGLAGVFFIEYLIMKWSTSANAKPTTPKDQQAFIGRESEKHDSQRVALTSAMLEFHTIAFLACGKTPAGNINSGPEWQTLQILKDAVEDGRLLFCESPSREFNPHSQTTSHDLLEFCERHRKHENLLYFARQWAKEVPPRHYVLKAEPGEFKVTGANVEF